MKNESEQTQLLWKELDKDVPEESIIRELVAQGANISGEFLMDAIFSYGLPFPPRAESSGKSIDIKYFKLLIELGADVNYEDTGFNSLFQASLCWNVELVKLLVEAGANVNCIATDERESLLSYVHFDQWYEEQEGNGGGEPLAIIENILIEHGAKFTNELFAERPEEYLRMSEFSNTGLFTKKGHIEIGNIPGADASLIHDFKQWIDKAHPNWEVKRIRPDNNEFYWVNPPNVAEVIQHNKIGLALVKKIKGLVGNDIKVEYCFVNPRGIERFQSNIESIIIGEDGNPVKQTLLICDYYDSGLLRNDWHTIIECLTGVDKELMKDFNDWVNESHELLKPFRYTVGMIRLLSPQIGTLKEHNRTGLELAKRIKAIVGEDYKVYYSCVNCEFL